jgi:type III secretory pathway component EscR
MRYVIIDLFGVLGVVMLAYGLWLLSPQHMFIGIGLLLILFALSASHFASRGKTDKT